MYKKKIIEKVLLRDLQSTEKNTERSAGKPRNDKDGKRQPASRVAVQR